MTNDIIILLLIIFSLALLALVRTYQNSATLKSLPEYKNMQQLQDKIQSLHGDNKKIEGQINALDRAFSELTHRVNDLPKDIKLFLQR